MNYRLKNYMELRLENHKMTIEEKIQQIKYECLEICIHAGTGHVTSAFSCAEIVALLYYEIMNIGPEVPDHKRDRFVMSKNHGSVITYPILADLGFVDKEEIYTFLDDGSRFGSHSKLEVPGVDFAGGSLGIGIGVACGMAYTAKCTNQPWATFCLVGDGECYEGSVWEAAMFAGHNKLNHLVVIVDRNRMTVTGFTDRLLKQDPMKEKWSAFGFDVVEVENGHEVCALRDALSGVKNRKSEKPLCIIANTIKGHGVDFMENNIFMHGAAPAGEKAKLALAQIKGEIQ